jgi:hypothetical protein
MVTLNLWGVLGEIGHIQGVMAEELFGVLILMAHKAILPGLKPVYILLVL